jgi:dissimilatory sulfite reductase (desulfoviridin) alpha/beta subunit
MAQDNIDYEALKKRGFLRQRQEGFFVLRTRMPHGVYHKEHLEKLIDISRRYALGFVHLTTRQGIEMPFIQYAQIRAVERELKAAGIQTGTSGARLRTTTCCPGNNWCKSGLIDTFTLYDRIENELGISCAMDLPHKFKIAISGCPNTCTRPQHSEIGIYGTIDASSVDKKIGYTVYLGGCGGRTPRMGFKLEKFFSEDEVLSIIARVLVFYKEHAKPRQRLALLIEEVGKEHFLEKLHIPQA